jgi:hypothetical protein
VQAFLGPRDEKIVSGGLASLRGGVWQLAGNIRQVGALFGGRCRPGDRETLRLPVLEIVRSSGTEEREGRAVKGDASRGGSLG